MEVTEIRIRLNDDREDKLQAYCSVTFDDCFVVRDIKIIRGPRGTFVAMPSRKIADPCPKCRGKNHLRALFCNDCGFRLSPERAPVDGAGRAQLYADVAHPIHAGYRERLQRLILDAYEAELLRADQPGYAPPLDVYPDAAFEQRGFGAPAAPAPAPEPPPPRTRTKSPTTFGEGIFP